MPAERQNRRKPRNAKAGPSSGPKFKVPALEARDGLPGVSKLKGQIRQTKRLLAKDKLEAALRVATQRRLTALEADLALAEKRGVEKKNGTKYHAVKFFERQKLCRLIRRLAREAEAEGASDKKKAKAAAELLDARVMLNYIINFPNSQKYIAIFPPEKEGEKTEEEGDKLKLPRHLTASLDDESLDKPTRKRLEILIETKRLMEEGTLSGTPEVERRAKVELVAEDKTETKEDKKEAEADDFFDASDDESD